MARTVSLAIIAIFSLGLVYSGTPGDEPQTVYDALDKLEAADQTVQLDFPKTTLEPVFFVLGKSTSLEITSKSKKKTKTFTIQTDVITIKEALIRLAETMDLEYEVLDSTHLVVSDKKR